MASPSVTSTKTRQSRAPRVFVPNREKVKITVGSQPAIFATIYKLSATGGSVLVERFFGEGLVAEIMLETVSGEVRSPIQFLRSGVDGLSNAQAFQFVHMSAGDQSRLTGILNELRSQGLGDVKPSSLSNLRGMARRALSALQVRIS